MYKEIVGDITYVINEICFVLFNDLNDLNNIKKKEQTDIELGAPITDTIDSDSDNYIIIY